MIELNLSLRPVIRLAVFIMATLCASTVSAAEYRIDQDFGLPVHHDIFDRAITIAADARWVNVTQDETVKFLDAASGNSFIWKFDTIVKTFDLARVAPSGFMRGHHIAAYVARNPLYHSGS